MIVSQSEEGGVNQMTLTMIQQLSSQLSKAVKEMKVSVLWKAKNRTLTYSITTYLVFYNQVNLPGAGAGAGGLNQ